TIVVTPAAVGASTDDIGACSRGNCRRSRAGDPRCTLRDDAREHILLAELLVKILFIAIVPLPRSYAGRRLIAAGIDNVKHVAAGLIRRVGWQVAGDSQIAR